MKANHSIQVYAESVMLKQLKLWFYEDPQELLELPLIKDVLYIIRDWNAKVGTQEVPGVTGKFGLGVHKEAGQRLTEYCQENALVRANNFLQKHKTVLCT